MTKCVQIRRTVITSEVVNAGMCTSENVHHGLLFVQVMGTLMCDSKSLSCFAVSATRLVNIILVFSCDGGGANTVHLKASLPSYFWECSHQRYQQNKYAHSDKHYQVHELVHPGHSLYPAVTAP